MKYIVLQGTKGSMTLELPIIFPNHLVHADVAGVLLDSEILPPGKWSVVSAGEFTPSAVHICCGHSETLNIGSRGTVDELLISMHDYGAGIK